MTARQPQGSFQLAALLTILVTIGPISTGLYLPSLPSMARDLDTSASAVQLSIGLFIGGFALMQLAYGPLADRFGRRPVLLVGVAIYILATLACALASSIMMLVAARFVQALGGCAGPVIGRAIVRDVYGAESAARILSYMASVMVLAPWSGRLSAAGSRWDLAGAPASWPCSFTPPA
jgi:DHA1 family bicyclomycin/chloramphenicol resistance-like MFS transporter